MIRSDEEILEAKRQIEELENGNKIIQQTRKWDDNKGKSFPMRSKENSNDYRYFPDPDLLSIEIAREDVEEIRATIPPLAQDRKKVYVEKYNLPEYDAKILTNEKFVSDYFEKALSLLNMPKQISNWIMTEVLRELKDHETLSLITEITGAKMILLTGISAFMFIMPKVYGSLYPCPSAFWKIRRNWNS